MSFFHSCQFKIPGIIIRAFVMIVLNLQRKVTYIQPSAIFLDEIGEMAFELQAKLLRILETGEYIKIRSIVPGHQSPKLSEPAVRPLSKLSIRPR